MQSITPCRKECNFFDKFEANLNFICESTISTKLKKLSGIVSQARGTGSFYAISQKRVWSQFDTWKRLLPKVKPFYAVKCNYNPTLLGWLYDKGSGFDCASAREIDSVVNKSPAPEIIFANPCKKDIDIKSNSTSLTVVDSTEEIDKLQQNSWRGSSLIRLRVEDKGSKMPFSAKFGADLSIVKHLAEYAKVRGQHISGVSFHVGSGGGDVSQYSLALKASSSALCKIKTEFQDANIIDIGGGMTENTFPWIAKIVQSSIGHLPSNTRLIAEPGRFMANRSQDLFVKVIGKKPSLHGKGFRYTLDESLYGQFSCIPYDHATPKWIRVSCQDDKRKRMPAVLYGRTCDSVDLIAVAEDAEELFPGDWLWFPHMGAYTSVTSTEFNGFPKPEEIILNDTSDFQLPEPEDFNKKLWPNNLKYVSVVKTPN